MYVHERFTDGLPRAVKMKPPAQAGDGERRLGLGLVVVVAGDGDSSFSSSPPLSSRRHTAAASSRPSSTGRLRETKRGCKF